MCNCVTITTDMENSSVSLDDILHFISGSSKLPAAGFPRVPSVHFTDTNNLPTTSTCDVSITFPRCFDQLSYEKFKEVMDLCILNSCGFGGV